MNNETIFNAISKLDDELLDGSFPETQPAKKKPPMVLRLVIAAAALLAAAGIGAGVTAYTADVKEYNNALEFFANNSLSTEGLSRSEIKEVYRDITTNSFSSSATVTAMNNSIPGLDLGPGLISSYAMNSIWISNFVIVKTKNYICNGLRSTVDPGFDLPEGRTLSNGWYVCDDFPESSYDSFISYLESLGFSRAKTYTGAFFFKDDCAVLLSYVNSNLDIGWYKTSPYAPSNGMSVNEAKKLFCPEKSLSPIDLHPIDVTPEGFYTRTGGQLFAVPGYTFDYYALIDSRSIMAENEYFYFRVYYVNGSEIKAVDMEKIAVFDIDGEGTLETCFLSYGPTSGLFTFGVTVDYAKGSLYSIFRTDHVLLSFVQKDGTVKIRAENQISGEEHFFDIKIESAPDGSDTIVLYENGEPVRVWG